MDDKFIDSLIENNPQLKNREEKIRGMKPGTYCIHRNWGFGKIEEFDEIEEKLVINFVQTKDKNRHLMAPAFCVDKLDLLPCDHILGRKYEDPEGVARRLEQEPVAVVIEIIEKTGRPLQPANALGFSASDGTDEIELSIPATELERILELLYSLLPPAGPGEAAPQADPKAFRKWWNKTKKLLGKEPLIATPARKSDPYILRRQPITPEEEILDEFNFTRQSKQKILLAEKLLDLSKDKNQLKDKLPEVLRVLTDAIRETRLLSTADRLHGVWVRNDLARDVEEDVESLEPTSTSILKEAENDLSSLALDLPPARYQRFLDLITRVFPDKWQDMVLDLLRHSEGRFTGVCIQFFIENGKEPDLLPRKIKTWLKEQTIRGPILLWIIKNRSNARFSDLIQPFLTPDLLKAIFYAIDNESLLNSGIRRIPLADALMEDRTLIQDLLADVPAETARDLAQTLMLSQGFEDLMKKSLMARFIKVHSSIQSLLDRSASEVDVPQSLVVSAVSLERRRKEYDNLVNLEIPQNLEAIASARELGDLRENSEYKMARQDQETLQSRKSQLEEAFSMAQITDFQSAPKDRVGIGSVVVLRNPNNGEVSTFAILGAWDGDPENNILSYQTPKAQALLGRKVGEAVSFEVDSFRQEFVLEAIRRWVDEPKPFSS